MNTYIIGTNKLDDTIKQSIKEHKTKLVLKNKTWVYNPHANSVITTITLDEYDDVSKLIDMEDRHLRLKYNSEFQTYIFPIGDMYGIFTGINANSSRDIYIKLDARDDMYNDCSNTWFIDTHCFCIDEKSYVTEEDIVNLKTNIKYVSHMENYYNNTHGMYLPLNTIHELFTQLWSKDYITYIDQKYDSFMIPNETPAEYRLTTDLFDLSITINKPTYKLINVAKPVTHSSKLCRFETEINKVEYDNIMFIYEQILKYEMMIKSNDTRFSNTPNIVNTNSCYEKDGKYYIQFTKFTETNVKLCQEIHLRFTNYANKFSMSTINFCSTGEPIKNSPPAEIINCMADS